MGIAIPQVVSKSTTSGSGAQVIDGSLKFDEDNKNYLKVTPGSNGNRRTWTWSGCCLLYTSPSPRDISGSRMPSSA